MRSSDHNIWLASPAIRRAVQLTLPRVGVFAAGDPWFHILLPRHGDIAAQHSNTPTRRAFYTTFFAACAFTAALSLALRLFSTSGLCSSDPLLTPID